VLPAEMAPRLKRAPCCLRVRTQGEVVHAVVAAAPAQAQELLREQLDLRDVRCNSLGLEDLFVELVG